MNLVASLPKPPSVPQVTVVLAPSFAITALASGLLVQVRARPVRRETPCG